METPELARCFAVVFLKLLQQRKVPSLAIFSSRVGTLRRCSIFFITTAKQRAISGIFVNFCSLLFFRGTTVIFFFARWW